MDAERRRLERDATDPGRLLAQRVRAGELSSERVALAAFLGDPVAREVIGDGPQWLGDLTGLLPHGPEAAARAAATAVGCQPIQLPASPGGDDELLRAPVPLAIEALEAWTLDRDPGRRVELRRAIDRVELHEDISELTVTLRWAAAALGACAPPDRVPTLGGFERELVRDELVAWACERSDPVRRRLVERAKEAVRAWTEGTAHDDAQRSGRLQVVLLAPAARISWASACLVLCLERVERRPELEAALDLRRYQGSPQEARDVVDAISRGRQERFDPALAATYRLGGWAAKVIYNAHGHPSPYDQHAGLWVLEFLREVDFAHADSAFTARLDAVAIAPEVRALAASG